MEPLVKLAIQILSGTPIYFVLTLGMVVLVTAVYFKVRNINIGEITTLSKLQSDAIKPLLEEIKHLSESLTAARMQIDGMSKKITELEDIIRDYKGMCDSCPHKKK